MSTHGKDTIPQVEPGRLVLFACQQRLGNAVASLERAARDAGFALRMVPLPCSSALEPAIVLRAFEEGADAVQVLACAPEACQTGDGSRRAALRMARAGRILADAGMGEGRVLFSSGQPGQGPEADLTELIEAARAAGSNLLRKKP